ncbi:MAG: ABC transporter permease [Ardenticatenaceae bacterium]|nr:ABC transporter permease [Ardenticatenaceae bacterium]
MDQTLPAASSPMGRFRAPRVRVATLNRLGVRGLGGGGIVLLIATAALVAPLLRLPDPTAVNLATRQLPPLTPGHPLGTDMFGRDLLSRVLWGGRLSLSVGLAAALIASTVGSSLGILAGYLEGPLSAFIMRVIDGMLAFPSILLAIVVVAVLGPSLANALVAIAIASIPFYARMVRGAVLSVATQDYILAAVGIGESTGQIMARHVLPNVLSPILVTMSSHIGWVVIEVAGLNFLGLGAQPPSPEWGAMIAESRQYVSLAPYMVLVPAGVVTLVGVCFSLLGDAARDALDPATRVGHQGF